MKIFFVLAELFWLVTWILLCTEQADAIKECSPAMRTLVFFILLIGTPFFLVANALEALLGLILPEDWNDDGIFKRF